MHGQDDQGVLAKTLQARLDEILRSAQNDRYQSALPVTEEWVKAVEQRFTRQNSRTADAYDKLAGIYLLLHNHQKSEEAYRVSLEIDRRLYGEPSRVIITTYHRIAEVFLQKADYPKARETYQYALRLGEQIWKGLPEDAIIRNNLAGVNYLLKEYPTALNLYQEALSINETKVSRISEQVVINLYNMALTYEAMGNKGTAEPLYKQAKDTLAKLPPDKITLSEQDKQRILAKQTS